MYARRAPSAVPWTDAWSFDPDNGLADLKPDRPSKVGYDQLSLHAVKSIRHTGPDFRNKERRKANGEDPDEVDGTPYAVAQKKYKKAMEKQKRSQKQLESCLQATMSESRITTRNVWLPQSISLAGLSLTRSPPVEPGQLQMRRQSLRSVTTSASVPLLEDIEPSKDLEGFVGQLSPLSIASRSHTMSRLISNSSSTTAEKRSTQPEFSKDADFLSKEKVTDKIMRYDQERTVGTVPTLRQILRVDDDVSMYDVTRAQRGVVGALAIHEWMEKTDMSRTALGRRKAAKGAFGSRGGGSKNSRSGAAGGSETDSSEARDREERSLREAEARARRLAGEPTMPLDEAVATWDNWMRGHLKTLAATEAQRADDFMSRTF